MQIMIDIPDRIHYGIQKGITVNGSEASQILIDAVKNGTPLPKGHKRLIEDEFITVTDIREDGSEFTYVFYEEIEDAPTIIEADKS